MSALTCLSAFLFPSAFIDTTMRSVISFSACLSLSLSRFLALPVSPMCLSRCFKAACVVLMGVFDFSQSTNIHNHSYSWPVLIKRKMSKSGIFQCQLAYYPSLSFLMASLVNGIRDCCCNLIENWRIDVENKEALTDWVSVFLLLPQERNIKSLNVLWMIIL